MEEALQQPDVLIQEYRRRLEDAGVQESLDQEHKQVEVDLKRLNIQEDRITDAYISEAMELDRYKQEMDNLKQRRRELEKASRDIERRAQQELLRLVVERITVETGHVRIETVIPTGDDKLHARHPESVEGLTGLSPLMVRQAHHERKFDRRAK